MDSEYLKSPLARCVILEGRNETFGAQVHILQHQGVSGKSDPRVPEEAKAIAPG